MNAVSETIPEDSNSDSNNPQIFVLHRELSEVHLLLDNISSNPNKTLSIASSTSDDLPDTWLKDICQIQWPPKEAAADEAGQAELLIKVKDHLNTLAKPASGATIAFTLLVTQEAEGSDTPPASPNGAASPSRGSMACVAYPDLWQKARHFRRAMWWISTFLLGWLVLTCLLSWYVAFGNAALTQRATVQAVLDAAQKRVEETEAPTTTADAEKPKNSNTSAQPSRVMGLCDRAKLEPRMAAGKISVPQYESITQMQACQRLAQAKFDMRQANHQIARWLPHLGDASNEDLSASAATLANILGTAALPVFYGILGAGAAIVRVLSRKMNLSTLAPRDLNISLQRLALGAVMGACIGLFVSQPSASGATAENVLGPVTLSGSALSFIAGFGVDAVFETLESVIGRIFNVRPAGTPPPPPAP